MFIVLGILAGYFDVAGRFSFTPDFLKKEFSLGPDLQGGISLEYKADTSSIPDSERSEERRVGKECRSRWSPYH